MSWDSKVYIDEAAEIWEGSKFTDNDDGTTALTFKNGSSIVIGPLPEAVGTHPKILLLSGDFISSPYLEEAEEQIKTMVERMRIFKVKCRSCKGNYQLKDPNSIFFTKCKLCGSGKLQFNK